MTNPNMGRPTTNKHKVPAASWREWTNHGRCVFNKTYEAMRPSMQFAFLHPKATPSPRKLWETTRYNAAYTAARAASKLPSATGYVTVNARPRK